MTSATACPVALGCRAPLSVTAMTVTNIATKCWHWRFNCAATGSTRASTSLSNRRRKAGRSGVRGRFSIRTMSYSCARRAVATVSSVLKNSAQAVG
jgi:hypothetical protein